MLRSRFPHGSSWDLPPGTGLAAGVVATVVLATSSTSLTGWGWLDVLWLITAGIALPLLCRRASWSAVALAAVAVLCAGPGGPLVAGVLVAVIVLAGGLRASTPRLRAGGGAAVLVLVSVDGWHRSSWSTGWLVAAAVVALLVDVAVGPRSAHTWQRRAARRTLIAGAVFGVVGAISLVPPALGAKDVRRTLGTAVDAARAGDLDVATARLGTTADRCRSIHRATSGLRGAALRVVPGLGRQVSNTGRFSAVCARDLRAVSQRITAVRSTLTPVGGRYDLAAVARLPQQLADTRADLRELTSSAREFLDTLPIPRIPGEITRRITQIERVDGQLAPLEPLAAQLPAVFGEGGPRRYFVMFLTPAEGRPLGGFMGNWAIVRADHGLVEIERSGRASDLNAVNPDNKRLTGLEEFRERYEAALSGGVDTPLDPDVWFLYTVTPDFPTAAEVARQLAPQSGIGDIDGVIGIDIDALVELIRVTGPMSLPEFGLTVDAASARQLLLVDQYRLLPERQQRVPFLQAIGDELGRRLTAGEVGLTKVASALRDDIDRGGVGVWFVQPAEQAAAVTAGLAPSFPRPEGHDGFIVTTQNRSPNKLDAFLRREIEYRATIDPVTGAYTARGTVKLTNTFDPSARPLHTESWNVNGDGPFSVRDVVCVYSPHDIVDASSPLNDGGQLGWNEGCSQIVTSPGQTQEFTVDYEGTYDLSGGYCFVSRGQVTANPDTFHVVVTTTDGRTLLDIRLDGARTKWLVGPACPPE